MYIYGGLQYDALFFRRLQAIETERLPQILAIHHGDEEEEEDKIGDEGFTGMRNDSDECSLDSLGTTKPKLYVC